MSFDALVVNNTPVEEYDVNGCVVSVKRDDLCSPLPGPCFAKVRGLLPHIKSLDGVKAVGVLSTLVSKAGWGVSYICNRLKLKSYNFHPTTKKEGFPVGMFCERSRGLGGEQVELVNSRLMLL